MAPPVEECWFKGPLVPWRSQTADHCPFIWSFHSIFNTTKERQPSYSALPGFEPTTFLIQASVRFEAHTNPQDHGALACWSLFTYLTSKSTVFPHSASLYSVDLLIRDLYKLQLKKCFVFVWNCLESLFWLGPHHWAIHFRLFIDLFLSWYVKPNPKGQKMYGRKNDTWPPKKMDGQKAK